MEEGLEKPEFKIEIATKKDLEAYEKIRTDAKKENPEAFGSAQYRRTKNEWLEDLTRGDRFFAIAKFDSGAEEVKSIVGAEVLSFERSEWHIFFVYTRPNFRQQGIGEKLLRKSVEEIQNRGGLKVSLFVNKHEKQEPALKMYRKIGFEERHGGHKDKEDEDGYEMELDFTKVKDNIDLNAR